MVLDSLKAFVGNHSVDVLTYYCRDDARLDDQDFETITGLVNGFGNLNCGRLILMIHAPIGGNINPMFSFIEFLKSKYTTTIDSLVLNCAVSSGSFLALSCHKCYLGAEAYLSDFTLDPKQSGKTYLHSQRKSIDLSFAGACQLMPGKYWISKFVLNTNKHGTPIFADELVKEGRGRIRYARNYIFSLEPLVHLHNNLIDQFSTNDDLKKIYGLNDTFFAKY